MGTDMKYQKHETNTSVLYLAYFIYLWKPTTSNKREKRTQNSLKWNVLFSYACCFVFTPFRVCRNYLFYIDK